MKVCAVLRRRLVQLLLLVVFHELVDLGIPVVAAADGPSGIEWTADIKASQVPIGTLLGCTWNGAE
ncbi:hypothetical protein OK016_02260 [Vibrio chagasii]|nr:hypothetical protein [Vibrio chagasii]